MSNSAPWTELSHALIVLAIAVVLLLAVREILCWYWKINEGLRLLRSIDESLRAIAEPPDEPEAGDLVEPRRRRARRPGGEAAEVVEP